MTSQNYCRPLVAVLVAFACVMAPTQSQQVTRYTTTDDMYLMIDAGVMRNIQFALTQFMTYLRGTNVRVGALLYSDRVDSAFEFTSDPVQFANMVQRMAETSARGANVQNRDVVTAVRVMVDQVRSQSTAGRARKAVLITDRAVVNSQALQNELFRAIQTNQIAMHAVFINPSLGVFANFSAAMRSNNVQVKTAYVASDVTNRLQEIIVKQYDMCSQCYVDSGMALAPHSSACDRFITCTPGVDGTIIAYDRACPPGSMWNQMKLTCQHFQEYQGGCTKWCTNAASTDRYPTEACTAYWECEAGKPRYKACPTGTGFDKVTRTCRPDPSCPNGNGQRAACIRDNFRLVPGKPCWFAQRDVQQDSPWTEVQCPESVRFNVDTCRCDIPDTVQCMRPVAKGPEYRALPAGGQCLADFCLTFDDNTARGGLDSSTNLVKPWIDDNNDDQSTDPSGRMLFNAGSAVFDGRTSGRRLRLPYYSNMDWKLPLVIKISFLESGVANADQVLLTNGDCDIEPSLYIRVNPGQRRVTLSVRLINSERFVTTSANYRPEWNKQWKTVTFVYNGETLSGRVENVGDFRGQQEPIPPVNFQTGGALSGNEIKRTQYPLQIGFQSVGEPFEGQMDNICIYQMCGNPEI